MIFDVIDILQGMTGYKGLPFPGGWIPGLGRMSGEKPTAAPAADGKEYSHKGTSLYRGRYFMPVTFIHDGTEYPIDVALVGITGKKTIVETPLVGRQGTVKELIDISDYEIEITGAAVSGDLSWPEERIEAIVSLYGVNEAVSLKCALTDLILEKEDKVVITSLTLHPMPGVEHAQMFDIKCVTDRAFELTIK